MQTSKQIACENVQPFSSEHWTNLLSSQQSSPTVHERMLSSFVRLCEQYDDDHCVCEPASIAQDLKDIDMRHDLWTALSSAATTLVPDPDLVPRRVY